MTGVEQRARKLGGNDVGLKKMERLNTVTG